MAAVVLDRQSVVPLYFQIQQRLSEQIRSGELKPGEFVPSLRSRKFPHGWG